jgi:hypothetical protein
MLIAFLNTLSRSNLHLAPEDVSAISEQYEYADQYLQTYWGQATRVEKLVSLMIVTDEEVTPGTVHARLTRYGIDCTADDITQALRILELYGIVAKGGSGYNLRAKWFRTALSFYGGVDDTTRRFLGEAA